jgi:2-polyprenyl-3-methyl-5-hydroxy-6-metoxy-1,4-benzoquinol methylase
MSSKSVYQAAEHAGKNGPGYRRFLEYLVPVTDKRVREIACGRGGFTNLPATSGAVMLGADLSAAARRIAQEQASPNNGRCVRRIALAQADDQNLPYANESFDVVISCETIEHAPEPLFALSEMARVCRARGLLYLTTPNYFSGMGIHYLFGRFRHRNLTPEPDHPFDRVFQPSQVRRILRSAGWEILHADGHRPAIPGSASS